MEKKKRRPPVYAAGGSAHRCLWARVCGHSEGEKMLPFQADLPPGIDQKQINFHFQLGIQLSPKWRGGGNVMFTYSSCGGRA